MAGNDGSGLGNNVFLNGTSSAGKSAIAGALQEVMETPYVHTDIDHFLERFPERFHMRSDGAHPATTAGFLWVFPEGDRLSELRIGPAGFRLWVGMYRAVAGLATVGNDDIVDDVVFDPRVLSEAVAVLHALPVLFVSVRCPLDVAEQRERDQGDRTRGLVRAHFNLVHVHGLYDLELDTSIASLMECALRLKAALDDGHPCQSFTQLERSR